MSYSIFDAKRKIAQNSNTSFIKRRLRVQVTLAQGSFKGGGNSIVIDDLGMVVKVEKSGPPEFGKASVEIYGLSLNVMEQLSTLNMNPLFVKRNYLNIFAGDDKKGMSQIFAGTAINAAADMNSAPDIKFKIEGRIGFWGSVKAQGQNVVAGTQPVAGFIQQQAGAADLQFENQGVSATIKDSVFFGSPIEQARQAATQVGAELVIDDEKMYLIPNGASVKGGTVPKLSATTGLLGYPVMTQNGIECKAIYDPAFRFAGLIEIESAVPKTSGQWRIIKLSHNLAANLPNTGNWESSMTAYYPAMSGAIGKYI